MGILVVAAPQVFFVEGFERAARLIDDKTLVFRHALDLYAAPAERDVRVFKKLLGFAEIFVRLEIDFVVVKQTAYVAHHHVRAHRAGQRHDFAVAELFKHPRDGLVEGQILFFAELHGVDLLSYLCFIEINPFQSQNASRSATETAFLMYRKLRKIARVSKTLARDGLRRR